MNIIKRIKRIWYRFKNHDAIYSCPIYKSQGCAHVDSPICILRDCDIINKHMDFTWVSCISCQFNDECGSKHYGLGCHNGIRVKYEKV